MNIDDLYRLLRSGHVQAQGIVDTVTTPLIVLDRNLTVQSASRSFYETFKVDRAETVGRQIYDLGNGQWNIPDLRLLLEDVIPRTSAVINYQVDHTFDGLGPRTMLVTARTLVHPDNVSHTMLLSIVDATEQYRRDAARDMLFDELRHRIKNLLGVAQALARQTQTEGRTAEQYRDDFLGRFRALTNAHDVTFDDQNEDILRTMVERILAPYAKTEAIVIDGQADIVLGAKTLLSLSLVLHELATNAAKYGALSVEGGKILVHWAVEEKTCLRFTWTEQGGPEVSPPQTHGYGTRLIQSAATFSLGGKVEQRYERHGLETEIVIPFSAELQPERS